MIHTVPFMKSTMFSSHNSVNRKYFTDEETDRPTREMSYLRSYNRSRAGIEMQMQRHEDVWTWEGGELGG